MPTRLPDSDLTTASFDFKRHKELLYYALGYAKRGWHVFPLYEAGADGCCACGNKKCSSPGKHPRTKHGLKDATTDRDQIEIWWRQWPLASIGIRTGKISRLVVMDVDARKGGDTTLLAIKEVDWSLFPFVARGNGGHVYMQMPADVDHIGNRANFLPGIDIRGDNGYVVAPPSQHIEGDRYIWTNKIPEIPPIPAMFLGELANKKAEADPAPDPSKEPDWLKEVSLESRMAQMRAHLKVQDADNKTQKSQTWNVIRGAVRSFAVYDSKQALEAILENYNARCSPPWSEDKLKHKIFQAYSKAENPEWGIGLDEHPINQYLERGKDSVEELRSTVDKDNAKSAMLAALTDEDTLTGLANLSDVALDTFFTEQRQKKVPKELCAVLKKAVKAERKIKKQKSKAEAAEKRRRTEIRPEIIIRNRLTEMREQTIDILAAHEPQRLYTRAGSLVHMTRYAKPKTKKEKIQRATDVPVIVMAKAPYILSCMDHAIWWRRTDGEELADALPPEWIATSIQSQGEWPKLLPLEAVVEEPTLRPDGTIIQTPGYDHETGILYVPSATFPTIPDDPTDAEIQDSINALLGVLQDFPFVLEKEHRAATLAAIETIVCRFAIDGPVPMFSIRAPTQGTGKGLLMNVIATIATGRQAAMSSMPERDEELRKQLLAIAIAGDRTLCLDNVEGSIGSPSLAMALTAAEIKDRILGESRIVTMPMRCVWFCTGNNTTFKGDVGRRIIPIDLDAQIEHPSDREGFEHEDLMSHIQKNRPSLLAAALIIARGFFSRGAPNHEGPKLGSFENWDDVVRSMIWNVCGLGDPCKGREQIREDGDAQHEELSILFETWQKMFGNGATIQEAIQKAGEQCMDGYTYPELRSSLEALSGGSYVLDAQKIGFALRCRKNKIAGGLSIEVMKNGKSKRSRIWVVKAIQS